MQMRLVVVWLLVGLGLLMESQPVFAKRSKRGDKTIVDPSVSIRSGQLERRRESAYHKDTHTDNATHFYLSLKFVRTYNYRHEVVIEPAFRSLQRNPEKKEMSLDQAYIGTAFGPFDLTAGRKTEYEGSGFFLNPSDLLNEDKDLFDPMYQKEGKTFGRLRWRANLFSFALGFVPEPNQSAAYGKIWTQMGADLWETDVRLQHTYKKNRSADAEHHELSTVGLSLARFFGDHLELHYDGRWQQRQRNVADQEERKIFNCTVVTSILDASRCIDDSELTYDNEDPSIFHLVGTRIVFTPKRSVVLEGIQNQSGLQEEELQLFFDLKRAEIQEKAASDESTTADPISRILGRRYVFAGYQDDDTFRKLSMNLGVLHSLTDGSSYAASELRYTFSSITNISLAPTFYLGDAGTEFGEQPFSHQYNVIFRGRF